MEAETTRQRIVASLRADAETASSLSRSVGAPRSTVYEHLRHVARSLDGSDDQLLVAPPECGDCGFDGFNDPLDDPSRCPHCRSEDVREAAFKVE